MKNTIALLAAALLTLPAFAEEPKEEQTMLEIVVTGGTNYQVQQTVAPTVYENSAHIQETAPGMKSPYIGAFTGNQVDQTVNGIRMNNALFRSGPNQYYGWIPDSFVQSVGISDGGNVGGTINRELAVAPSHLGVSYNSGVSGFTETGSYKDGRFGIAFSNTNTGDVRTSDGKVPHTAFNQRALMLDADWSATQRTVFMYSESNDIERTDKWNGGWRSSGYQAPSVYTWELQKYVFLSHDMVLGSLKANLGFQNHEEKILDGTKRVHTNVNAYTANLSYALNSDWSVYSSNTYEDIRYENGVSPAAANDSYVTTKQGLRYENVIGGYSVIASGGAKQVKVSGFDGFNSYEGSLIIGRNGFFTSLDVSTNAPGYASLKQSTTSGKGTSVPNPTLKEEQAMTYRFGYKKRNVYADVYYKHFTDAIVSQTIAKNTYKPVNYGEMDVYGATIAGRLDNVLNSGVDLTSRLELAYGKQSVVGGGEEPVSKTPQATVFLKADYKNYFAEWKYSPKDNAVSSSDADDVRMYAFNRGYNLVNIGYGASYGKIDYKVALNNVLNNDGRVLGSSVNVPGRSVVASMKYNF